MTPRGIAAKALASRQAALDLVRGVLRRGLPLDEDSAALEAMDARDRAFARAIALATLRRLGQIDALIAACLARPLPARDGVVHDILRIATAQLLFVGVKPHAAVDGAVELTRTQGRPRHAGLVNAVLRKLAREGRAQAEAQDAPRLDTPEALWRAWRAAYGEETARAIAAAHLDEPPLDLGVKTDPQAWAERLGAEILPTGSLRLRHAGAVTALAGYTDGAWWVQDAAAALPARLLGGVRGATAIDLCAAPGGKTAQLAAMGAHVVAVDHSKKRLGKLRENLTRLKLSAEIVEADAASWKPPAPARFVLLDAPCAATGSIRRHPDVAHLKRGADLARLTAVQDRMLGNATAMLAPGGILVYAVCSLAPEEGPERIASLLERAKDLERHAIRPPEVPGLADALTADGDLRTLPCHWVEKGGIDGFYVARLARRT